LAARLIANFHRRQVSREEKEEWINGLAKIYKSQGLSDTKLVRGEYHNEIKEKLMEVTGLSDWTVYHYLAAEFKQEAVGGGTSPPIPASEKVEKVLGKNLPTTRTKNFGRKSRFCGRCTKRNQG